MHQLAPARTFGAIRFLFPPPDRPPIPKTKSADEADFFIINPPLVGEDTGGVSGSHLKHHSPARKQTIQRGNKRRNYLIPEKYKSQ